MALGLYQRSTNMARMNFTIKPLRTPKHTVHPRDVGRVPIAKILVEGRSSDKHV